MQRRLANGSPARRAAGLPAGLVAFGQRAVQSQLLSSPLLVCVLPPRRQPERALYLFSSWISGVEL